MVDQKKMLEVVVVGLLSESQLGSFFRKCHIIIFSEIAQKVTMIFLVHFFILVYLSITLVVAINKK